MTSYNVAFLDVMDDAVRREIANAAPPELKVTFANATDREAQLAMMPSAQFIIAGSAPVTAEMIQAAPSLRMIHKWGIGYDKIDLDAAKHAGVAVAITAGANAGPVSEHAVALMLAVYRRLALYDRKAREGVWMRPQARAVCYQISGKTVGLLGFGNIARMVAHRLRGFDAEIVYTDVRRADQVVEKAVRARYVPMDELLARSDIVSLHVPLTPATRSLINADTIARMKTGAVLINTARGGIVDEAALYDALVSGKLHGAGLDVLGKEPFDPANPLLKLDQVVVSPHTAGSVFDNVANVARRAFGNMQQLLSGGPIPPEDLIVPPGLARAA